MELDLKAKRFRDMLQARGFDTGNSTTAIVPIIIDDVDQCMRVAKACFDRGVYIQPVLFPAVKRSRLRAGINLAQSDSDLVRAIEADVKAEFLGTASYGNAMQSSGEVKLTLDLTTSIEGKTVLLVEDIIDTGLTMEFLTKTLAARKPKKILTSSLLFKPDALKVDFKPDYVGFKIPSDFVIGCGLDYQGFYRNLPYIARVESLN